MFFNDIPVAFFVCESFELHNKNGFNSTFEKLKTAFSLVLKLKCEVAIFNFTNLQKRYKPF